MKQIISNLDNDTYYTSEIYKIVKINKNLNLEFPRGSIENAKPAQLKKIYVDNDLLIIEKGLIFKTKLKLKIEDIKYIWITPELDKTSLLFSRNINKKLKIRLRNNRDYCASIPWFCNNVSRELMGNIVDNNQFNLNKGKYINNDNYIDLPEDNKIENKKGKVDFKLRNIIIFIILLHVIVTVLYNFLKSEGKI